MINILVVDDSGVVRLQIKQMLKGYSCNVCEASTGMQVIMDMFSSNTSLLDIDIVLLDIHLGEIDGYQVLAHIKENYPNLPVIMISLDGKQDVILKSIQTGASDFLLKPFTKESLIAKISKFHNIHYGDQNDLKEIDRFVESLLLEIDRALRVKTVFIVLVLVINQLEPVQKAIQFIKLKKDLQSILRRIDSVFISKNKVFLLLPYTQKCGLKTVKERVYTAFEKRGINFSSQVETKAFIFPDNVSEELIKTYNFEAIKDLALQKLI